MPTVLIADDHELLRTGVRDLLRVNGWEVCAEARNGREAVALATQHRPDVTILDLAMPELNGIESIRRILEVSPNTHILVFTGQGSEKVARDALAAGARGYMLKSNGRDLLLAALEALSKGGTYVSGAGTRTAFSAAHPTRPPAPRTLTPREREIVQLLAEGNSYASIALTLGVGVRTVETHRAHILQKLRLASVADLVRYAIRNNIVQA